MTSSSPTGIAVEFRSPCASGKVREACARHVAENLRRHNTYFPVEMQRQGWRAIPDNFVRHVESHR